jgi:ribonuclease Z
VVGPPRRCLAFAYVTDTRPLPSLASFAHDVDLLVCEGTYGDPAEREKAIQHKHMTFAEAATLARDAGAATLWLTHFSPALEDPSSFLDQATSLVPTTTIGFSGLTTKLTFDNERSDRNDSWS